VFHYLGNGDIYAHYWYWYVFVLCMKAMFLLLPLPAVLYVP